MRRQSKRTVQRDMDWKLDLEHSFAIRDGKIRLYYKRSTNAKCFGYNLARAFIFIEDKKFLASDTSKRRSIYMQYVSPTRFLI